MTYNVDWLHEFPYWTFDEAVATATDEFPSAWKEYWGIRLDHAPEHLDPDDWDVANQMHDTARRICAVAARLHGGLPAEIRTLPPLLRSESEAERTSRRELVDLIRSRLTPDDLKSRTWIDILRMFEWEEGPAEGKEKLFRTAVQIYAFPEFGSLPGEVGSRLTELLEFLVRAPGDRAREYLGRVATCYIRNMAPEMAVMSRAVMEAALDFSDVEKRVEAVIQAKGKRHPSLADWIDAASALSVIDEEGRIAADVVKNAGDDAVHNVPQQVPEPRVILENLTRVLNQIDRYRKRRP